ncbi:18036_t:CDS:2 [Dentiscutata erythropus]|uniref:18036_t:CDS:1 n=1 Tax=Dentiscutata erythropus TaxID=1348616 RepID=A0A9N9ICY1_9GLOM|nr:18036_t:CDS:2 [Dentiscutata erythropus]
MVFSILLKCFSGDIEGVLSRWFSVATGVTVLKCNITVRAIVTGVIGAGCDFAIGAIVTGVIEIVIFGVTSCH